MKPKFNIGDPVYFRSNDSDIQRAVIQSVLDGKDDAPVYLVRLSASVVAVISENRIFGSLPEIISHKVIP